MDRLPHDPTPTRSDAATDRPRDFTLRRGEHVFRLRADAGSGEALLREIRRIARPGNARRAA